MVASGFLFKSPIELRRNFPVNNDYRFALDGARIAGRHASEHGGVLGDNTPLDECGLQLTLVVKYDNMLGEQGK